MHASRTHAHDSGSQRILWLQAPSSASAVRRLPMAASGASPRVLAPRSCGCSAPECPLALDATNQWKRFPNANVGALLTRLDASKYLAPGLYRQIPASSGSCVYVHVVGVPEDASDATWDSALQEYLGRSGAPMSEVGAIRAHSSFTYAPTFP